MKNLSAKTTSRKRSLLICCAAYITGIIAALAAGYLFRSEHPLVIIGAADLAGTIVVFIFSMAADNSSIYDPYWSVAPIVIAFFLISISNIPGGNTARQVIVFTLVFSWGMRLTFNWLRHWQGLAHEDWRYVDIREKTGKLYWPASFLGIHLFPTIMVFLGCLSLYPLLLSESHPLNIFDFLGAIVAAAAIYIEATADRELHDFSISKKEPGTIMESGLWAYSRHPNYFGEVLFWWGLFIITLGSGTFYWWAILGPAAINIMFLYVSIPMMDKRMVERRPHYAGHMEKVSALVPWFRKE